MGGSDERIELTAGAALGPFRLGEKLAQGGMAEIWSAQRDGPVALKVLLPDFASDPGFRAMFHDEVSIATRLDHPNIVQVHGAYDVGGHLFQSMELVDGRDLRRFLSLVARHESRAPIPQVLTVAIGVARGLAHAHSIVGEDGRSLGIVHRDVSPHNIMLTQDGRVLLLDFGIARAAERLTRTRTGVIKGKVAYMAPEQALAVGVTEQTDVFAAGVVLWEMLAMRRLFRAPTDAESIELVIRADVPPVRALNPDVPDTLAELVHRMLALRAPDRPSSMTEVVERLESILRESFANDRSGPDAIAAWYADHVEVERADTLMLSADPTDPSSPPEQAAITEPNPAPPELMNSTTNETPIDPSSPTGESGVDPSGPTGETPVAETSSPTEAIAAVDVKTQSVRAERIQRAPLVAGEVGGADVRLPTQSEIIRAVESQRTVPIHADPSALAHLPEVIAGPSTTDETAPPSEPFAVEAAPAPLVEPDDSLGAFERIAPSVTPPTDRPPAPPAPTPPAPRAPVTSWLLPTMTAVLGAVVVILLILLFARG